MQQTNALLTVSAGNDEIVESTLPRHPNDQYFNLVVVTFADDGSCSNPDGVQTAEASIRRARIENQNGAVVLLFIHGWHHGSEWADTHYQAFRDVLRRLTLREAERYRDGISSGRHVIGIYLAWNGDPKHSCLLRPRCLRSLTFWDRYDVAQRIGGGEDMRDVMRAIVLAAKEDRPGAADAQLVLTGHSMGGLILESAFLSLLNESDSVFLRPRHANPARCVRTCVAGVPCAFPDLMLSINSAADAGILKEVRRRAHDLRLSKSVEADDVAYAPPVVLSVSSSRDAATAVAWRVARAWRRTSGHDPALKTHRFASLDMAVHVERKGEPDFGQSWHGLRKPEPLGVPNPTFAIDLPARKRRGPEDTQPGHLRHVLTPIGAAREAQVVWAFEVPGELIPGHNDIFEYGASTLFLALMQISGAVVSLARDWRDSFE